MAVPEPAAAGLTSAPACQQAVSLLLGLRLDSLSVGHRSPAMTFGSVSASLGSPSSNCHVAAGWQALSRPGPMREGPPHTGAVARHRTLVPGWGMRLTRMSGRLRPSGMGRSGVTCGLGQSMIAPQLRLIMAPLIAPAAGDAR